jgi:hypothetical protein
MLGDSCNGGMPERTPGVEWDGEEEGEEGEKDGVQGVQSSRNSRRTTTVELFGACSGTSLLGLAH